MTRIGAIIAHDKKDPPSQLPATEGPVRKPTAMKAGVHSHTQLRGGGQRRPRVRSAGKAGAPVVFQLDRVVVEVSP